MTNKQGFLLGILLGLLLCITVSQFVLVVRFFLLLVPLLLVYWFIQELRGKK